MQAVTISVTLLLFTVNWEFLGSSFACITWHAILKTGFYSPISLLWSHMRLGLCFVELHDPVAFLSDYQEVARFWVKEVPRCNSVRHRPSPTHQVCRRPFASCPKSVFQSESK